MSLDRITRLAADVVASLHEARVTVEPIRLKYVNLGDFGGTNPVQDSWVLGNTFPVKGVMSHYGFKFTSGKFGKGWWLPTVEFHAVGDKWANDIIKGMPAKQAPTGRAVFTEMSMSELVKYLVPVVEQDMEDNEHYDGEVSSREVLQGYIKRLRAMSPQAQQDFYDRWAKGHRRA